MRRVALYAWWLLVVAAWVATILLLENITEDGNAQAYVAFGASVAAGLLIGRWWVLAVPAVGILLAVLYGVIAGTGDDDVSAIGWVLLAVIYVLLADIGLAAGVFLHRLIRAAANRVPGTHRAG